MTQRQNCRLELYCSPTTTMVISCPPLFDANDQQCLRLFVDKMTPVVAVVVMVVVDLVTCSLIDGWTADKPPGTMQRNAMQRNASNRQ